MRIDGRVVVVTGASRGIGAATAAVMARRGGRLALLARSEALDRVAADIVALGGQARAYRVDVTDAGSVHETAGRILAELGVPDIVVNNAGAGRFLAIDEAAAVTAVEAMASPYFGAYFTTHAFLPAMIEQGRGYIVNVTSPASRIVWPGATAYAAARWAMRGFSEALRADLAGTGVRVMLVTPSKVRSTYFEHNPDSEARIPAVASLIPTLTPEAVATAIVRGVERDQRTVVVPRALRLLFLAYNVAPWPIAWLMIRTGWRRSAARDP